MLLRVSCERCRLSALWTDDPRSFLATACEDPAQCRAEVLDEQAIEVSLRFRETRLWHLLHWDLGAAVGIKAFAALAAANITAAIVVLALTAAYAQAEIVAALCVLALPSLLAIPLYAGSPRSPTACFLSLLVASSAVVLLGVERSTNPLNALVLVVASVAVPVTLDLVRVDVNRSVRFDAPPYRMALPVFLVILLPLLCLGFVKARQVARAEDVRLIERLARRLKPEGDLLVIDRLSPQMAEEARNRVSVRAEGRTYELSRATLERIVKKRTTVTRVERGGETCSLDVTAARDEDVRLVVKLRHAPAPSEIELDSRRGPTTIYSELVALETGAHL
jgi:hypothetical protein